jgi:four helix bundle protein
MSSFEDLDVWKRSYELSVQICRAFQRCSDFGFKDQITRAAVSLPSNIAEGSERNSRKEFAQFLGYGRGSAGELRTQLMIAGRLGYITDTQASVWVSEIREISAMIYGLTKSLEK